MSADSDDTAPSRALTPARALADLLPFGVLLIEGDATLALASARACEILGAADEAALRARWNALQAALSSQPARAGPQAASQRYVELDVGGARRRLRVDVRELAADAGAQRLILLEGDAAAQTTHLLVAAGGAQAQQHVASGVLHDVNGRLNNFNLTLTLLETTLARHAPAAPVEPMLQRCTRYAATLVNESRRLGEALRPLAAMVAPDVPSGSGVDVAQLLDETRTLLRHAAVLNEVALSASVHDGPLRARGDYAQLRVAMLNVVTGLMARTPPGGDIAIDARARAAQIVVRFNARGARIAADIGQAFDRLTVAPPSGAVELLAARAIFAAQGGDVDLRTHDEGALMEAHLSRESAA